MNAIEKLKEVGFHIRSGRSNYVVNPAHELLMEVIQELEFKENIALVCNTIIASAGDELPVHHWTFCKTAEEFTARDLQQWFEATECYYSLAKQYEEKQRGSPGCVDRARQHYLRPKCQELLEYLVKKGNEITGAVL